MTHRRIVRGCKVVAFCLHSAAWSFERADSVQAFALIDFARFVHAQALAELHVLYMQKFITSDILQLDRCKS